jgi:hypothetical protein
MRIRIKRLWKDCVLLHIAVKVVSWSDKTADSGLITVMRFATVRKGFL